VKKKNKKESEIILRYYLPLAFWMGLIFYFSSLPGIGRQASPDIFFYVTRKGAHLFEFFILTFLIFRVLKVYEKKKDLTLLAAGLLALLYALIDEIHQLFVIGREGKFLDVGVDLIGIVLAMVLINMYYRKSKTS